MATSRTVSRPCGAATRVPRRSRYPARPRSTLAARPGLCRTTRTPCRRGQPARKAAGRTRPLTPTAGPRRDAPRPRRRGPTRPAHAAHPRTAAGRPDPAAAARARARRGARAPPPAGPPPQPVQPLIAAALVPVDMAGWMEDDRAPLPPVGVHPQDGLLGHGAAGHEPRGGFAEEPGDLPLKLGHRSALAIPVGHGLSGHRREQVRGTAWPVTVQEPGTGVA